MKGHKTAHERLGSTAWKAAIRLQTPTQGQELDDTLEGGYNFSTATTS